MKKNLKKALAMLLALCTVVSLLSVAAFAAGETDQTDSKNTVWYGDEISRDVVAGTDGFAFVSVYPGRAYEMSNHMVSEDGGAHNDIPQTLVLVDADKNYTWTPNGLYSLGTSNYEVMYCCDVETPYEDNIYYKRLNLEDSNYYDAESAAHIRAIVTNSYPYISLEQMKKNLADEGFEGAADLTRAEVITAVQTAIWAYANGATGYAYSQTFDIPSNSQWGKVFHDYTNEMDVWWGTGKRVFTTDETVAARISALAKHLQGMTAVYAEKNQVIISGIKIVDAVPVQKNEDVYKVALQVLLNNSGSSQQDELYLTVAVDGTVVKTEKVVLGTEVYDLTVEVAANQTVETVVSGSQILPAGVYFYEPQGGRKVSQCLVGVAAGKNEVYSTASATLEVDDPVSCDLKLQKTDDQGNALTGAEFALYVHGNTADVYVDTYAVDENGQLTVENLLPGSYKLVETVVPDGFEVPAEPVQFTIDENGVLTVVGDQSAQVDENGVLVVKNTPEVEDIPDEDPPLTDLPDDLPPKSDVPKTGDVSLLWLGLSVLSGCGVALVGKKRED